MSSAPFDLLRLIRAGCRRQALDPESRDYLTRGRDADYMDASVFNCLASALLAIDESKYARYSATFCSHCLNGAKCGATGGDDVFNYHYPIVSSERALDGLSRSVCLWLLSHCE